MLTSLTLTVVFLLRTSANRASSFALGLASVEGIFNPCRLPPVAGVVSYLILNLLSDGSVRQE